MARPRTADGVPAIRRIAMKCGLVGPLLASGLVLLSLGAHADVLRLTSPAIPDNGTLATKNACNDKQRSPNCVGKNISPPLAWSGVPEGIKSFALLLFDPEGRAPAGVSHMGGLRHPGIGDEFC